MPSIAPQPGIDYPGSFHELTLWCAGEEACLRYLERVRWGDGFVCRFCGAVGGDWWAVRRGLRRCAVCRHETSVTGGTIFHGSRLPLRSWFAAIWYVINQKHGVSALGLQRVLGRQLPDRVGVAAQAASRDGAAWSRTARRRRRGR